MGKAALLSEHPCFALPQIPAGSCEPGFKRGVEWGLKAAAAFISPPKVDGEDEEFACADVAEVFRGTLRDRLFEEIDHAA